MCRARSWEQTTSNCPSAHAIVVGVSQAWYAGSATSHRDRSTATSGSPIPPVAVWRQEHASLPGGGVPAINRPVPQAADEERRPWSLGNPFGKDSVTRQDISAHTATLPTKAGPLLASFRRNLPSLLAGVRRSILEIGAGTGLITMSLADWTPAEIFALEPSAGMRAVLVSRLSLRPELLNRVTVLSCDALSVRLDEPAEAVVMINVMYALEPDYRKRLWPVLAASPEPAGLLVLTWRDGGPPVPRPLQELESRQVGRHTYTVLSEIIESDREICRARYLYRITEGDKVISEEEITGYSCRPPWDVLQRELVTSGFAQAEGAEGLLAWRLA